MRSWCNSEIQLAATVRIISLDYTSSVKGYQMQQERQHKYQEPVE